MSKTVSVTGPDFNSASFISKSLAKNGWKVCARSEPLKAGHKLIYVQSVSDINISENDITFGDLPETQPECVLLILNMQNHDGESLSFQQSPLMSTIRLKTRKLAIQHAPQIRINMIVNLTETEKSMDGICYLLDTRAVTGQVICLTNSEI